MGLVYTPDYAAAGLTLLIAVLSFPSLQKLVKSRVHPQQRRQDGRIYEDEDGVASEDSIARFSNKVQFIAIFVINVSAIILAGADAIFTAVQHGFTFSGSDVPLLGISLLVPAWILLLLQLLVASRELAPVERFNSVTSTQWTGIWIVCIASLDLHALNGLSSRNNGGLLTTSILTASQIGAAIALMATIWTIQRRPDVFRPDGRVVDSQKTLSLWARYSFEWGLGMLRAAGTEKFENSDMPAMDHIVRAENATASFKDIIFKPDRLPLWAHITWKYRWQFLFQWSATLFTNFFDVAPAFANLQLLRYLETRDNLDVIDPVAWIYVAAIVIATISSRMVDSRVMWSEMADIVIPLRSTLTGLMYEKLMRMEDSLHIPKDEKDEKTSDADAAGSEDGDEQDKQPNMRSQQDIVNMFSVDCDAIARFGSQSGQYINCAGQFAIIVIFLLHLVGWQSLCAGMLGILVLFPINRALAARYGANQKILMKLRDKRSAIITEALHGIRQIKFSAIESQWTDKIEQVRERELAMLWKTRINNFYMAIASEFTPIVLTALSLATYSYINGTLLPSVAFTAITLFMILEGIVEHIPLLLVTAINAKVSCDRIDRFFRNPDKKDNIHPGTAVSFHDATITFPNGSEDSAEDRFALRKLNLEFPNNALSVISGPTGSGKSLLLASILGEAEVLAGYIQVPKAPPPEERYDSKATAANWILPTAVCFVSQIPWIENATIKNNVLFGLPFDPVRYDKVLQACALSQDLSLFEDGDETEVGAQGVTLSGGQKWRLTLARALYSRAGIMVIDDVFSALDAHVGKHVFANALLGELGKGRTRILVTHHTSLCLPRADYAVHLSATGLVEHAGSVEELRRTGVLEHIIEADDVEEVQRDADADPKRPNGLITSPSQNGVPEAAKTPKKLVEDEKREVGRVKTSVYVGYLKAFSGLPFWVFLILLFAIAQGLTLGRTYWIKVWSSSSEHVDGSFSAPVYQYRQYQYRQSLQAQLLGRPTTYASSKNVSIGLQSEDQAGNLWFYLGVYCLISTVSVLISVSRLYCVYAGSLRASRRIFQGILRSVLRAPLRWLDTVPTGRILNRFTGDFTSMDSSLATNFYYFATVTWEMFGIMVAALWVSPFMIFIAIILLVACGHYARRYMVAARTIKRLESTNKSPVISHFASSLAGLSTIRAFAKAPEFTRRMFLLIDDWAACSWYITAFRMWLMLRIGVTASMFAAVVGIFVVTTPRIDASLAGFVLSFALNFGHAINWGISASTQTELDMNATERIFEYQDLEIEKQDGEDVRASWPEEGRIEVEDLEVGYAEGLPSILKGLSFTAERNQRIGIVGRTGGGKSTFSLALFRFLQTRSGSITIDGVDISKIKLHDLRTRLAIIPQDPFLFSGTIRTNLDPFNQFSDYELQKALIRVHLVPSTPGTPVPEAILDEASSTTITENGSDTNSSLTLSSPVASGGSNLSQGQKQLLCLARAILSRPKILLLDEATSAVDMATDRLIQQSIRQEFSDSTLLVIAHRLSTVVDFDRILVIKEGKTAEFGTPKELLEIENGLFREMVSQSGEKEELVKLISET
ncbi:P-loop containing nucleoside triphosphate hydrolase protein [Trichoderma citrinoviride]|uniref:P-loop containing nucleoside triphosphate hydrolase protein n=1 Tax=Trichoderma citrinoviride TaxID=58853 RepID=A0A2T4BCP9_9HYPO|nr:P-loop containing nucleoside triphosphate hydrolase protein [Trichoderma citrinoviride]PTB66969.1 P-loop containing nucleoside triphosphate hydrolase protein [Trichoderma citrinoviride]